MTLLLSRDSFREGVFKRDNYQCVICGEEAKDAHHILERRLFPDGGYYLDNGASLCHEHHYQCEQTLISVEDVRIACGITKAIIPPHLYNDQPYDKWGNPILQNGTRIIGELFFDESVQKVLQSGGVLDLFTPYVKYPRTYHLPWTDGMNSDDRIHFDATAFQGKRVIATEKMDGENTTMYTDYIHARSVDGRSHPSRDWVKSFWSKMSYNIPKNWRVCGENLYAEHSIPYNDLSTYFMGFSIWNENNICLSWDDTIEWFNLLEITPVPVLYDDIYDEEKIKKIWDNKNWSTSEGYVLRVADEIPYGNFRYNVGKFVRENHVQTNKHWMHGQQIINNKIKVKENE